MVLTTFTQIATPVLILIFLVMFFGFAMNM